MGAKLHVRRKGGGKHMEVQKDLPGSREDFQ